MVKEEIPLKKSRKIPVVDRYCYGCYPKGNVLKKTKCDDSSFEWNDYVKHGKQIIYKDNPRRIVEVKVFWDGSEIPYQKKPHNCNADICKKCMGIEFSDCFKYKMWTCKKISHCDIKNKVKDINELKNICEYHMEHIVSNV